MLIRLNELHHPGLVVLTVEVLPAFVAHVSFEFVHKLLLVANFQLFRHERLVVA